jgi:hypothetical protein
MTVPEDNQFRPRPTVYKGVRMRSRLEASVAAFLDREDLPWTYEPSAFADERGQYLPDFRVGGLTVELPLYVDVKGRALDDDELAATFDLMATNLGERGGRPRDLDRRRVRDRGRIPRSTA